MNYALLLYFEFFEFYVFSLYLDGVGAGIDLGAGGRREHLELVGRGREGDIAIHEHRTLRVGDGHACLDGVATGVLIAETEGILLSQAWFDDEGR